MSPLTESTRLTLAKGQPVPNDPYLYTNTVLLLHGDGTNGSTNIVDSSKVAGGPKVITVVGSAQISTAQSKFGGSSLSLVGGYLTISNSVDFGFGSGDFTSEAWIYNSSYTGDRAISDFRVGSGEPGTFFVSSGKLAFWYGSLVGGTGTTLSVNTWHHVALSRSGSTVRAFLNGTLDFTANVSGVNFTTSRPLGVGAFSANGASAFNGYIDDLRITKGVARYTSNFTPPTAQFPDF